MIIPYTWTEWCADLDSLIKQASAALCSIIMVAEKLVRHVNAACHIAHKVQGHRFRVHEDVHGNVAGTQPPTFPSWRGPTVTGLPEVQTL